MQAQQKTGARFFWTRINLRTRPSKRLYMCKSYQDSGLISLKNLRLRDQSAVMLHKRGISILSHTRPGETLRSLVIVPFVRRQSSLSIELANTRTDGTCLYTHQFRTPPVGPLSVVSLLHSESLTRSLWKRHRDQPTWVYRDRDTRKNDRSYVGCDFARPRRVETQNYSRRSAYSLPYPLNSKM